MNQVLHQRIINFVIYLGKKTSAFQRDTPYQWNQMTTTFRKKGGGKDGGEVEKKGSEGKSGRHQGKDMQWLAEPWGRSLWAWWGQKGTRLSLTEATGDCTQAWHMLNRYSTAELLPRCKPCCKCSKTQGHN